MPLAARPPLCFITNDTSATMYGLLLSAACYWCAKLSALTRKTGQDWLIPRHSRTRFSMTKRSVGQSVVSFLPFAKITPADLGRWSARSAFVSRENENISISWEGFSKFRNCFSFFLFAGEKGGRKEKLAFREITGNKSFATFIRVPRCVQRKYNVPVFPNYQDKPE